MFARQGRVRWFFLYQLESAWTFFDFGLGIGLFKDMDIIQFPMFEDNYGYLLRDGKTVAIDPGDAPATIAELERRGLHLDEIWNTHHHWDHAGGNAELIKRYGCRVVAPALEAAKIGPVDRAIKPGEQVPIGEATADVIDVGGHTLGQIAYYFKAQHALFCGDAVFGLGCGRLFEGTHQQMWESLNRVMALPDDTLIYCAHEYLLSNAGFAMSVEGESSALVDRIKAEKAKRTKSIPTVPMKLSVEKKTNPFLRPADADFMTRHFAGQSPEAAFKQLRQKRDTWKS